VTRRPLRASLGKGLFALWAILPSALHTQSLSQSGRTIPIVLTHEIDAAHMKSGDAVTAKTIQALSWDRSPIRAGATVLGHVVEARPFAFDATPYAKQHPSTVSVHFDTIEAGGTNHAISVWIRALAHPADARAAQTMQHLDEHDSVGYFVLIGGDRYRSDSERVMSPDGEIVGYRRRGGVYARLLSGEYRTPTGPIDCDASDDEQPVAIFSATACGVYGLKDVFITENGRSKDSGTFTLESIHHTVKLYKGTAALLQVAGGR
jgi:hypothetical protein